jgi:hypothetical protein
MGGARGFSDGCILLGIGQLPVISPEINALHISWAGSSPAASKRLLMILGGINESDDAACAQSILVAKSPSLISYARDDPAQEMTWAASPIFDPDQGNHKLSFVAFCEITRRGQPHDAPSRCSHSNNCPGPQHSNRGHR